MLSLKKNIYINFQYFSFQDVDLKLAREELEYQTSFQKIVSSTENGLQVVNNNNEEFNNLSLELMIVSELESVNTLSGVELGLPQSASSPIQGGETSGSGSGFWRTSVSGTGSGFWSKEEWCHKIMFLILFGFMFALLIVVSINPSGRWASNAIIPPRTFDS